MNFFYMPVIIGAMCVITAPPWLRSLVLFRVAFYVLGTYQVTLALYLFGDWLFGVHPTAFIHPLVFMQTVGFFLLANIGAMSRLIEPAGAMFSVGVLLWLIVFFTNFQHVSVALDKKRERPSPTFFLFIAVPAQAAISVVVLDLAHRAVETSGDTKSLLPIPKEGPWPILAQSFHYVDLFIYLLMFRLFPTFWTVKFSVSWWAYIFPLSAAASTTIWRYKSEGTPFWGVLASILGLIACVAMIVVLGFTLWSLWSGGTPNNRASLDEYTTYYMEGKETTAVVEVGDLGRKDSIVEARMSNAGEVGVLGISRESSIEMV